MFNIRYMAHSWTWLRFKKRQLKCVILFFWSVLCFFVWYQTEVCHTQNSSVSLEKIYWIYAHLGNMQFWMQLSFNHENSSDYSETKHTPTHARTHMHAESGTALWFAISWCGFCVSIKSSDPQRSVANVKYATLGYTLKMGGGGVKTLIKCGYGCIKLLVKYSETAHFVVWWFFQNGCSNISTAIQKH